MKNLLIACLPALALFALGGCASTSAISSSEDDGVYYSSKDRTTAVVAPAPAPASTDEAANPDYNSNSAPATARQGRAADQYYDNTYSYMRGVPGYGPGLSNYSPYSPYATLSYPAYSSYGWGGGYSPYATGFYDPFFGPSFYSPYYGYGSGISISIGFGYGYGYGRPYGYGYGGGFYDPFYYSSPFYGGYYGRGGYYGNNYGGGNYYGGNYGGNGYYGNGYGRDNGRYRTSSHRSDRATDGRYSTGGVSSPAPGSSSTGGGRVRPNDGLQAPMPTGTLPVSTSMSATGGDRPRQTDAVTATPAPTTMQPAGQAAARADEPFNRPRRMDRAEQPRYRNMDAPGQTPLDATPDRGRNQPTGDPNQSQATRDERRPMRDDNRGRWRTEAVPQGNDQLQPAPAPQPQESGRRRGGFYQNPEQPRDNVEQAPEQPRQRNDEQPRQQRTYEQPRQPMYEQPQQRTYEQPQQPQQRSYEQPRQSEMRPSYSPPANSSGNEGGGGHSRSRED